MEKFGGDGRRSRMKRVGEMRDGARRTWTTEPLLGTLLQVRRYGEDLIREIVRGLGSSSNVRWSRRASVRAATAAAKLGIGHVQHSG